MSSILIVEDDASLMRSLIAGLSENGYEVTAAPNGRSARDELSKRSFEIMVLDLGLPDDEGLDILNVAREINPRMPCVITTARGALERRLTAFDAGADDYLVKPYAFSELLARLRIQLRHSQQAVSKLVVGDLEIDIISRNAKRGNDPIALSPREFDLLAFLAASAGQLVTRETLAREVWHLRNWTPSVDNAIHVHVSRLRDKIDRDYPKRLLHTIRGAGIVLREE
jgi:DNA-binding response OmpR family regulator